MTDIIKAVRQFTEAVGCTTDRYNVRQTALYIGLQLEEMAEKLESFLPPDGAGNGYFLISDLHDASRRFKQGNFDAEIALADRAAMLDADIDLAWVTIGSALSQGADVEGAAGEVARANLSKLVPCTNPNCVGPEFDGECYSDAVENDICKICNGIGYVAIKDENGKVKKPEGWTPPNIEPFVCKELA